MTITRRQALEAGAALGAAAAFGAGNAFAQTRRADSKAHSEERRDDSAVGIGTNRYGVGTSEEERAPLRDTMARFVELGGKVMDTAMIYGTSEAVIGDLAQGLGHSRSAVPRDEDRHPRPVARRGRFAAGADAPEDRQDRRDARAQPRQRRDRAADHARVAAAGALQIHRRVDLDARSVRSDGALHARQRRRDRAVQLLARRSARRRSGCCRPPRTAASRSCSTCRSAAGARRCSTSSATGRCRIGQPSSIATSWGQFFLKYSISHPAVTCAIPGTRRSSTSTTTSARRSGDLPDAALRRRQEEFFDSLS